MFQKGSAAIVILLAIVVSTIFAIGGFYIGRLTGTKPEAKPVTTSDTNQTKSTPSPMSSSNGFPYISPSPTPDSELVFPTVCISPTTNTCFEKAARIGGPKTINELINYSELIVVGHVTDSCLVEDLIIKGTESSLSWSTTPYIGHLIIERSFKNPLNINKSIIRTAHFNKIVFSSTQEQFSSECNILMPKKRYLLFLKKFNHEKFWSYADAPLEIQNSSLVGNSDNLFSQEIIQLGLDGLAERVAKLTK